MVFVMTFTNTTSCLSPIVTATMFSPVYETSNGVPENRTPPTSSHIVYLDPKGKLIDRVNIPCRNSTNISLRDDTIKCTDSKANKIYCYTLTGQWIWTFKNENVLRKPVGIALDKQVRKQNQKIAIPNHFYFSYNVHNFNINTTIGCTNSLSTLITSSSTAYI
jgi:outer membrane protein assembly factor BamB